MCLQRFEHKEINQKWEEINYTFILELERNHIIISLKEKP